MAIFSWKTAWECCGLLGTEVQDALAELDGDDRKVSGSQCHRSPGGAVILNRYHGE